MTDAPKPTRPKLITVLAVMQYLYAASYLMGAVKIIRIIFSDEVQNNLAVIENMRGLAIGATACVVWMVLTYAAARGLWCMKRWARWLALAANGFIAVTLVYSNIDDYRNHSLDGEDLIVTCLFLIPVIPFLLPVVGRAMRPMEDNQSN